MSTNFEKISSNKVKLTFVVPAEDFDKALNQAYLKDRSKINVPGFRKGKAPRAVIERMYGEGVFYDDALDAIFPALYAEAIKEHNIDVVDRPQVDVQEIGAGKELKFTAEVFVRPDVTLGEYKNLTVEVEPKEVVTEDEIQARISQDQQKGARTIDVTDRGYTLKIPVTNEQAKKVTIGEKAELVNYWWGGDDISATLESIGTDPANPSSGKQLTFRLNGAVEPGQSITLSIGQKSANYDCLVPNSAVRSDNNGSFVLLVTSKSSPLGNRYTATRVSVNVLASDDTSTAVTGLSAGDFVLTTSSKPVSSGMQVRLADES